MRVQREIFGNFLKLILFLGGILLFGCASQPKLDSQFIRPWSDSLNSEYPHEKPVIAHYQKNGYELFYLAAKHTSDFGDETLNLVQELFRRYQFNVILIESIPYSSGESPEWFLEDARKGRQGKVILGAEPAWAAILADEKKIPFYAGEPDHQDIYKGLKEQGYSDLDVIGFYAIRQIPQWRRQHEEESNLLQKNIPGFANHYCKVFSVSKCPSLRDIQSWYQEKMGQKLTSHVSNEEVAPIEGGAYAQKISFQVGFVRDHFTLKIIEQMLAKYKKVAVVYGAGHFFTLRKSFDAALGEPVFIEDKK